MKQTHEPPFFYRFTWNLDTITMSNYKATIVEITNLHPHRNADRLECTNIFGNNVIVGKDVKIGDIGVYFPVECQLSEEFARANDLIRRKDENGNPAGGMLEENRRVRAIKLRGERSEGLWLEYDSLNRLVAPDRVLLPVGLEFDVIGDKEVCRKYTVPTHGKLTERNQKQPRESRIVDGQFRFHHDTAQLGKNIHKITPFDLIAITWKLHGTSAIAANVLVKRTLTWLERVAKRLGVAVNDKIYDYVFASRRVIKNEYENVKQHYYKYDLWTEVGEKFFRDRLHAGETVYYEIVGYLKDGGFIQKGYDYKCDPLGDQVKVYVYRITRTLPDGSVVELPFHQVFERARQIGVDFVPLIYYGKAFDYFPVAHKTVEAWQEAFFNKLKQDHIRDQDSVFCVNQVPEEGICVRVEYLEPETYKLKSFRFLEHETKQLDKGEVDVETQEA
jgi:hypothetical protein